MIYKLGKLAPVYYSGIKIGAAGYSGDSISPL
jgi:hypothetical protein